MGDEHVDGQGHLEAAARRHESQAKAANLRHARPGRHGRYRRGHPPRRCHRGLHLPDQALGAVGTMADQTAQLKQITQETSAEMAKLVDNLAPVAVMPDFKQSLGNMNDQVDLLTNTLCASPWC